MTDLDLELWHRRTVENIFQKKNKKY